MYRILNLTVCAFLVFFSCADEDSNEDSETETSEEPVEETIPKKKKKF